MSISTSMNFDLASAGIKMIADDNPDAPDGGNIDTLTRQETKSHTKPQKPRMYKVLLLNDNTTPFDFVDYVLGKYFDVPAGRRNKIVMTAHHEGSCLVALYTKEIAQAKVEKANAYSATQENRMFNRNMELTFSYEPE